LQPKSWHWSSARLLHFIATIDDVDPKDRALTVRLAIGRALHRKLWAAGLLANDKRRIARARDPKWMAERLGYRQEEWSIEQTLRTGHWLLVCCWRALPEVFGRHRGVPFIHQSFEDFALKLCAELVRRDPVFLPSTEPRDVGGYWNKSTPISTTFVRD
jgi:hypothetical protein